MYNVSFKHNYTWTTLMELKTDCKVKEEEILLTGPVTDIFCQAFGLTDDQWNNFWGDFMEINGKWHYVHSSKQTHNLLTVVCVDVVEVISSVCVAWWVRALGDRGRHSAFSPVVYCLLIDCIASLYWGAGSNSAFIDGVTTWTLSFCNASNYLKRTENDAYSSI